MLFFRQQTVDIQQALEQTRKIRSVLLLIFLFCIKTHVHSQVGKVLSGEIYDHQSGDPLIGASIQVIGTQLGTVSDLNGYFTLDNLPGSEVQIEVSYVGYITIMETFDLTSQQATQSIRISLESSASDLEIVEVVGQAGGTIRAMIEQKESASIKNVISAEQIATFPDMNAAEVLQRIPGVTLQRDQGEGRFVQLRGTPPELTTFNINGEQIPSPQGDVRYVGMDVVASDQIEFIEVTKVLTPDMDADGIAGSVNIKTKEALGKDPQINATLAAGYGHLRQKPNYQMQFAFGQRYGKFGFQINSSFFQRDQGADNIEYKFAKGPFFGGQQDGKDNFHVQYREVQLRHYDIRRTRIGISPTFDFRFNKNSYIYIRSMYNSFADNETRRRLIYDLDDAVSSTYYLFGGLDHDVKDRIKKQELGTVSIGGEHTIGKVKLDYQVFYARANESEPNRLEATFDSPGQAIAIDFDLSDEEYPRATFPNANNAGNATAYDRFEMDELLLERSKIKDENITPRINIEIPYSLTGKENGYLKFGGKMRSKKKTRDINSQVYGAYFAESSIYPGVGPDLSLATVDDGFYEDNLLGKNYLLQAMPSADQMRDFFEFYPQHFIFDRTESRTESFGEDFTANEKIYATYGMLSQDIGKLRIIAGARFERTNIEYEGRQILLDRNRFIGIDTLTDERSHSFFLPQIQLKYALNQKVNIRAAWTNSYSRPNFEDVLPYREQDREEVKFGNPNLKYPESMNLDLLVERYYKKSIFSGGLFYKNIENFIFFFKRFAHEGTDFSNYGLVEITKAINGVRADVFGGEVQAQFKLDILPGFLKNIGVYANYTFTHSEAKINKRFAANYADAVVVFGDDDLSVFADTEQQEKIPLPGQAQHSGNLALFYDSARLFIRLTGNYQDDFLFQLGADPDLDEYTDGAFRLDLTANYEVNKNIKFFTDVFNITNTPLRFYLGDESRTQKQEFYSWWGRAGVKIGFN